MVGIQWSHNRLLSDQDPILSEWSRSFKLAMVGCRERVARRHKGSEGEHGGARREQRGSRGEQRGSSEGAGGAEARNGP